MSRVNITSFTYSIQFHTPTRKTSEREREREGGIVGEAGLPGPKNKD